MGFRINSIIAICAISLFVCFAALLTTDFYMIFYVLYLVDLFIGFRIGGRTRSLKGNFFKSRFYMNLFLLLTFVFFISCYLYFEYNFKGFYYLFSD